MAVPTSQDIRETLVAHFRTPSRQEALGELSKLPYFFEGWFTTEALIALRRRYPSARLLSNTNYRAFQKPDLVIEDGHFAAVLALKHIATGNPDAPSRWDGGKGSTVAKDILKLRASSDATVAPRVLVFYGPAVPAAHGLSGVCRTNRIRCVECSLRHLLKALAAQGEAPVEAPLSAPLLPDDTFHLLEFEP